MGQPVPQDDLPASVVGASGQAVPQDDLPSAPNYTNPIKPLQQGMYAGLADILGAPVDLASLVTGEREPVGGSRSIRGVMNLLPLPSGAPVTYEGIEQVPQQYRPIARAGEVLGASGPLAGAPFAVRRSTEALPKLIRPIVEMARSSPKQFLATEAATAAGAAQGAGVAELLAPDNTLARFAGEVVGGLANPFALATRGVLKGFQQAKEAFSTMTVAGRRNKAAELLQKAVTEAGEDPAELARRLRQVEELEGVSLTAGQKSGSPALLALEAKIASRNPQFDELAKSRARTSFASLRRLVEQMERSGDTELLRAASRVRQSYFNDLIASRLAAAQGEVRRTLSLFGGNKQAASTKAVEILEDSLTDARKVETSLWEAVPKDITVKAEGVIGAHSNIRAGMLAEEPLPPQFIEAFVSRVSKQGSVTSGELLRFRSQMLNKAREARAKGDFSEARQYSEMADGALADLEKLDIPESQSARQWSRELHDAFSRTFAGDALATRDTGGRRIPPELVLERAFGGGGTQGDVRFQQLQQASQFPSAGPGMLSEQEQFIRAAARSATDPSTGRVSPDKLNAFLRTNESLLARFPRLRKDLSDASTAESLFRETESVAKTASKAVQSETAFARVLETSSPMDAVASAVNGSNPQRDFLSLIRLSRRGPVGASDGLKSSALEYAAAKATDSAGSFSFEKYRQILNRPLGQRGPSMLEIMGTQRVLQPTEAGRLNMILRRAEHIEKALKSGARLNEVMEDPDMLFDLVVRITGANIGGASAVGQASGAPIVAAGAGSRFARQLFEKVPRTRVIHVLEEAAKDPKLMAALLARPKSVQHARQLHQQINAFLLQAGLVPDERQERISQIPQ